MKLSRKEKEKIEKQMRKPADRGPTWVGFRSSVEDMPHKDPKAIRRSNKQMCREEEDQDGTY